MEKEFEGKSLDQLIDVICQDFGCMPEDLQIEILEYSDSSGLLSISGKKVKVRARIKPEKILTERANKAVSFLKELFYYADFNIQMKINILKEHMQIEIVLSGEDTKYLLLNGAEPLSALEFLTNKIVAKALGVGPKIILTVEGINVEREKKLVNAVKRAIEKVKSSKEPQIIKVGNLREQKIVINILKKEPNLTYRIEGEEKQKRVIIELAK